MIRHDRALVLALAVALVFCATTWAQGDAIAYVGEGAYAYGKVSLKPVNMESQEAVG